MDELFRRVAKWTSTVTGSPSAFILSTGLIALWAVSGPFFNFSDTWQLVVNTATTVLTFLMVFLIQNTQNRDAHAIHLKLDEIIRAIRPARNELIDIEEDDDRILNSLQKEFKTIRETKIAAEDLKKKIRETKEPT